MQTKIRQQEGGSLGKREGVYAVLDAGIPNVGFFCRPLHGGARIETFGWAFNNEAPAVAVFPEPQAFHSRRCLVFEGIPDFEGIVEVVRNNEFAFTEADGPRAGRDSRGKKDGKRRVFLLDEDSFPRPNTCEYPV